MLKIKNKKVKQEIAKVIDDLPMTRAISNIPVDNFGYFVGIINSDWPQYDFQFNLNGYRYRIFFSESSFEHYGSKMILKDKYIQAGF